MTTARPLAVACAGLVSAALAVTAVTAGATGATGAPRSAAARVDGLNGPRGLDFGPNGKGAVAETGGRISRVVAGHGTVTRLRTLGHVPTEFPASVAVGHDRSVWALTTGHEGRGSATLFRFKGGTRHKVADIGRWAARHPDPFDLENEPGDSNPYNVAVGPRNTMLVADAGANAVTRVWPDGRIRLVARVKPRVVRVPADLQTGPDPLPPRLKAEAVTTSVTMGPGGAVYIGELRGFPGTPGTAEVWRVAPGAHGAVCRPAKPFRGACRRYADGLTSVVSLDMRHAGLFVAELSKLGWLAIEADPPVPGSDEGAVIRIARDRSRHELAAGRVHLPGAVVAGRGRAVHVTGPIFGPGAIYRVR